MASGGSLSFTLTASNNGQAPLASGWMIRPFLSADAVLDSGDLALQPITITTPLVQSSSTTVTGQIAFLQRDPFAPTPNPFAPGGSTDNDDKNWLAVSSNGRHQLFLVADSGVPDPDLSNNQIDIPLSLTAGLPILGFAGFDDQRRPQFLSQSLPNTVVGSALQIQADESLRIGIGNRMDGFNGMAIHNRVGHTDNTAPLIHSATIQGSILNLIFSESLSRLDLSSATLADVLAQFSVSIDGVAVAVQAVNGSANSVDITLARPVSRGAAVSLSYLPSTVTNLKLRDHVWVRRVV